MIFYEAPHKIGATLRDLAAALGDHSDQAAEGIMTTDTHPKEIAVQLTAGGRTCTIGGIAKGYASDRLADIFAQYGVDSALVSLGGNVYARGAKPGGQAWSVAVQHPEQEGYAAMLALTDAFAVTSGGYQRYFTGPDGTVYQHILNPKTGWPVQGDLLSVTIVADNGTMADAYSTALYVMGREAAQDFWRQNGGFDMVLITKDGQVLYTPGLADKLTETEGSGYAYASIEP